MRPRTVWVVTWVVLAVALAVCRSPSLTSPKRQLLIVVDGLRPDYVTADVMPNLTAIGRRGVVFHRHHSVYPTVTRVNASSISTGAYPETHGLLGNTVFFPRVEATKFLDTADRANLEKIAAVEGQLLTARTLGETLQAAGRKMLVVSSGSTGSAFLNNHTVAGGAILHYQYALPPQLAEALRTLGPPPSEHAPGGTLDDYAVDAFLKVGLQRVEPSVTVMWLSDLDTTAHAKGIGDAATVQILNHVDQEIGKTENGLKAAGVFDDYDIWVTSDHGFSTHTGGIDLGRILKPFAGILADGSPRVLASGGAIYVRDNDEAAISSITTELQRTAGIGAIFTRAAQPGSFEGRVAGTLSFDAIRWNHQRSAQILFSPDWTDASNGHGIRGQVMSEGTAGHGSSSPWDIHNTLIAAGPDLKQGAIVESPSANVDFAPTFLKLLGIPRPSSMQGRVLEEALVRGNAANASAVRSIDHTATTADGRYSVTGTFSIIASEGVESRYFDGTRVVRR